MAKKQPAVPKTFEEALAELERILSDIEGGEVGLEESLLKYERGNFLIRHCRGVLSRAEQRIEQLGKDGDETPADAPAEHDAAPDVAPG